MISIREKTDQLIVEKKNSTLHFNTIEKNNMINNWCFYLMYNYIIINFTFNFLFITRKKTLSLSESLIAGVKFFSHLNINLRNLR